MDNQQKYKVVTRALGMIESGECVFICPTIENILVITKWAYKVIPELLEYKPVDKKPHYAWWPCDENGKQERIRVLKELQHRFINN
jgi:hypothetical protein